MNVNSLMHSGEKFTQSYFERINIGEAFTNEISELEHHGILGQKWGRRRYQNPDGSLTEAGLKRYGKSADSIQESHDKMQAKIARDTEKRAKRVAKEKAKAKIQANKEKERLSREKEKAKMEALKQAKQEEKRLQEFEKKRKEILRDPKKVYQNFDLLTKDEIRNAMERFSMEERLRESAKKKRQAGKDYLDAMVGYVNSGIKAYNAVATIYNSLNKDPSSKWSKIEDKKEKQKNESQKIDEIYKLLKDKD